MKFLLRICVFYFYTDDNFFEGFIPCQWKLVYISQDVIYIVTRTKESTKWTQTLGVKLIADWLDVTLIDLWNKTFKTLSSV